MTKQPVEITFKDAGGKIDWMLEGFDRQALRIAATIEGAKAIVKAAAQGSYDMHAWEADGLPVWSFRYALIQSDWKNVAFDIQQMAREKLNELAGN